MGIRAFLAEVSESAPQTIPENAIVCAFWLLPLAAVIDLIVTVITC